MFFRDVSEGVTSMLIGQTLQAKGNVVIVGGNCSVHGVDATGSEVFWNVAGDVVSAMSLIDVDEDGNNELVVGSEDNRICIFSGESVISEVTESERITGLCNMRGTRYGYALANGTVGVYDRMTRVWRVKTKNEVTAIEGYDLDGDGVPELVSGWSHGRIEVRSDKNGEVVYKDMMGSAVAGIVRSDYKIKGKDEIICCATDGQIKAYVTAKDDQQKRELENNDRKEDEDVIRELVARKQELTLELMQLENSLKLASKPPPKGADGMAGARDDIIPPGTTVGLTIVVNPSLRCVELVVGSSNDSVVKAVVIFAEQIFGGESHVMHPAEPSVLVKVPIRPPKDVSTDLNVKVILCRLGSNQGHVFEMVKRLPRFSMYLLVPAGKVPAPAGAVTLVVPERISRLVLWMNQSFNIEFTSLAADAIDLSFSSLRTGGALRLEMATTSDGTSITIRTDSMELAGDIVQDLAAFLDLHELESTALFPAEMESLKNTLALVEGFNASRLKLSVDMADSANLVKSLVVKAEDARLQVNMPLMKNHYRELHDVNSALLSEYLQRSKNHEDLLEALKNVNNAIQAAARLRVGQAKSRVVAECRAAVKSNSTAVLLRVIEKGK
jgi:Bardet-Biedl syndrome 2 protein